MEIIPSSSSILTEMKEINLDSSNKMKIQVSNTKKPLFFYLNLAKKYIKIYNYVVLSALGMAIPTAITIAQILKNNGVAIETKVLTSTIGSKDETNGRVIQKPKIEILMERCENGGGGAKLDADNVTTTETENGASGVGVAENVAENSGSTKSCNTSGSCTQQQQEVVDTGEKKSNDAVTTTTASASEIVVVEEKKN